MRLGLSTVLTAALAVGLMACSSSTGDGAGGSGGGTGGAGSGGDDSSSSQGGGGTGGDTATGTGGGGGGTGDDICELSLEVDNSTCDVDCDASLDSETASFCTVSCSETVPCPEVEEGDYQCATDGSTSLCVYFCDVDACPSGFFCDDDSVGEGSFLCIPDQPDT